MNGMQNHFNAGQSTQPCTFVIRPNPGGGFFSNFLKVLSVLHNEVRSDDAAVVDWTLDREGVAHFPYGSSEDGNLWDHFFEPLIFPQYPDHKEIRTSYPEDGIPGAIKAYEMYHRGSAWRDEYHQTYAKHIRIKKSIEIEVGSLIPQAPSFLVGVHFRHPGHDYEMPFPIASPQDFIKRVCKVVSGKKNWHVLLATDVEEVQQLFRKEFSDKLIVQQSVDRAQDFTTSQLHEKASTGKVDLGRQVLTDVLLLSRCDILLHATSNVATAAGFISPRMRMIYCEPWWQPFDHRIGFSRLVRRLRKNASTLPGWRVVRNLKRRLFD